MTIRFSTTKRIVYGLVGFGLIFGNIFGFIIASLLFLAFDFVVFRPKRNREQEK